MIPKQKKHYILDIKNIEIYELPFWKEVKQIIIITILTNNWNNTKNTWKGIKSILSIKPNPSDIPKILNTNDTTITNPVEIANVFNNYFSFTASQTKVNIKYSPKHFSDFLKNRAQNSFFKVLLTNMK